MGRLYFAMIILLTLTPWSGHSRAVTPEDLGFVGFTIRDRTLGEVNYYVSAEGIDRKKPVLLYLDGSGPGPLFQITEEGVGSSIPDHTRIRRTSKPTTRNISGRPHLPAPEVN